MGLAVKGIRDRCCPILICDACGKEIENLQKAIATYQPSSNETVQKVTGIYHKVTCDPDRLYGGHTYSQELSDYLFGLLWNHKVGRRHQDEQDTWLITVEMPYTWNI